MERIFLSLSKQKGDFMIMKLLPLLVGIVLTGCATTEPLVSKAATSPATPTNAEAEKASYTLGLMHIKTLREGQYHLDKKAYERGLRDALEGLATADAHAQTDWQALADLNYAEVKAASSASGKAFLTQNKNQDGVISLPSGVQYQVLEQGKGTRLPTLTDTVGIVYKISGIDGKVKLDNLNKDVQKMYEMPIQKIFSKGWQEALQLMAQGSKWRLFIPGELAFGERGLSERGILPNETLIIETQLVRIVTPPTE
jgi:FKBP-type peptidyl-prolyl cis-trans isomerase FklB